MYGGLSGRACCSPGPGTSAPEISWLVLALSGVRNKLQKWRIGVSDFAVLHCSAAINAGEDPKGVHQEHSCDPWTRAAIIAIDIVRAEAFAGAVGRL